MPKPTHRTAEPARVPEPEDPELAPLLAAHLCMTLSSALIEAVDRAGTVREHMVPGGRAGPVMESRSNVVSIPPVVRSILWMRAWSGNGSSSGRIALPTIQSK